MSALLHGTFAGALFGFGCCALLMARHTDDEHTGIASAALGIAFLLASAWALGGH